MCFVRKLRKRLDKIQATIDDLYAVVKTKEYEQLKQDSADLKTEQELLSHIEFKLKNIRVFDDDNTGRKVVKIFYEQPVITLEIDEDNEPIKNDIFFAINRLNLTDLKDVDEIQKTLQQIKKNS